MRILALETTELVGSLAAAEDDKLLGQLQLATEQRTAQSLAPGMKTLLEQVGWRPGDVHLLAVTIGPGSFTGLRVGVATAKVFAYAVGAEVLGIDTLETIAAAAPAEVRQIAAAVDAQRGDVVAQSFRRGDDGWPEPMGAARLLPLAQWMTALPQGSVVTGPALKKWTEPLPPGVTALEPRYWPPTARHVARLALRQYAAGRRDDLWKLTPYYSRRSAAEEKWEKLGR